MVIEISSLSDFMLEIIFYSANNFPKEKGKKTQAGMHFKINPYLIKCGYSSIRK
jgi:hypothetical protein